MKFEIQYVGQRPEFGSELAAGYDLVAAEPATFRFGQIECVPLDLHTAFPPDKLCLFVEKSSMALYGFDCKGGLIDADYRKVWGVMLRYLPAFQLLADGRIDLTSVKHPLTGKLIESKPIFEIAKGQKLCNLVILNNPGREAEWKGLKNIADLPIASRTGGFGSTGA